jgi:D-alanyl-D-alanine carboxypeptidase/D-alanyl-D-alanine-endopeptidase (penicillin-binding protein 4)
VRSETADAPERARLMLAAARGASARLENTLAVRRSATLGELVIMINHRSHNLSAELAFRAIGRSVGGAGTFAAGAQAVGRFLQEEVGLPAGSFRVSDGSGLSLLDSATPSALVQLLAWMRHAPEGQAFYESLPIVGDGIRSRMLGTAAVGRLRAKTGTLSDVSALSGYVTTVSGEELAFALLVNGSRAVTRARHTQDSVGVLLSLFDRDSPSPVGAAPGAGPRGRTPAAPAPLRSRPRVETDTLRR